LTNIDLMFDDCVNLMFYGKNGSGKTYCASLIVKEAYVQRYTSLIITFQSLLDIQFKKDADEKQELTNLYQNAEFLVIDEVGKETQAKSGYNLTMFEEILRVRDTKGFPTIICNNMDLDTMYSKYGNSVASLIKGNFVKLEFKDGDHRYKTTQERKGIQVLLENGKLVTRGGDL